MCSITCPVWWQPSGHQHVPNCVPLLLPCTTTAGRTGVTKGRLRALHTQFPARNNGRVRTGKGGGQPIPSQGYKQPVYTQLPRFWHEVIAVGSVFSPRKLVILESICTTDSSLPVQRLNLMGQLNIKIQ